MAEAATIAPEGPAKKRARVASCDPCRTSKLACDHSQPCSRCAKRGTAAECTYRDSPFKRLRTNVTKATSKSLPGASTPENKTTSQANVGNPVSSPSPLSPSQFPVRIYPNAGFLGASSLSAVFHELGTHVERLGVCSISTSDVRVSKVEPQMGQGDSRGEMTRRGILSMNDAMKVEDGANILNLFLDAIKFDNFQALFHDWYDRGIALNLGSPLLKSFMEATTTELVKIRQSSDKRASLLSLSRRLFENGTKPLPIHGSMTLKEFCGLYTEENFRWETVGFVLTWIGLAAVDANASTSIARTDEERQRVRLQMIEAGDACIAFCESFDNLNDAQVILLFLNGMLHSLFDGDQSFKAWRRLSDVASAAFAFGLHENIQEGSDIPFFLVQQRKRTFARVYASDMSVATFLGRPPHIGKRYCYPHIPLDLDERHFELTAEELAEEMKWLDSDGWNTRGEVRRSSIARWSLIGAMIREDILELLLGKSIPNVPERIEKIKIDIANAWDKLPSFLKASRFDLWNSDKLPFELDMLQTIGLQHLHCQFLVERAITRHSRERSAAIFPVASEMLASINDSIVRRERLTKLGLSALAWKVMTYSLPAAGVLALELLQQSRRKWSNHPDTISRTQTIQDLSVLLVHMDVLVGPGDGNYQAFRQAKRALQSILDIILAPPEPRQLETPHSTTSTSSNGFPLNDWVLYDQWGFDGDFWSSLADHPLLAENDLNAYG